MYRVVLNTASIDPSLHNRENHEVYAAMKAINFKGFLCPTKAAVKNTIAFICCHVDSADTKAMAKDPKSTCYYEGDRDMPFLVRLPVRPSVEVSFQDVFTDLDEVGLAVIPLSSLYSSAKVKEFFSNCTLEVYEISSSVVDKAVSDLQYKKLTRGYKADHTAAGRFPKGWYGGAAAY